MGQQDLCRRNEYNDGQKFLPPVALLDSSFCLKKIVKRLSSMGENNDLNCREEGVLIPKDDAIVAGVSANTNTDDVDGVSKLANTSRAGNNEIEAEDDTQCQAKIDSISRL